VAGTATRHVRIDTTPPRVQVTGVRNGQVYPLGGVPAPGCTTTDSVSGVTTAAKVTVTGTKTGKSAAYAITAEERVGAPSFRSQATGKTVNPETLLPVMRTPLFIQWPTLVLTSRLFSR